MSEKIIKTVKCGFNKWSISVTEDGVVKIGYCYHPGYFEIDLHDASLEDLNELGEMFKAAATILKT